MCNIFQCSKLELYTGLFQSPLLQMKSALCNSEVGFIPKPVYNMCYILHKADFGDVSYTTNLLFLMSGKRL